MISQNWIISEGERGRILNLHENATKKQYLTEQIQKSQSVDFGSVFPSGQYILSNNFSNEISQKVQDIVTFIQGKNLKNVTIEIESGESRVTNQDPFGEPGSLATARAKELKKYLDRTLPKLLNLKPKIIGII